MSCFHPHPRIKYGASSNPLPRIESGAGSEGEGVCRLLFMLVCTLLATLVGPSGKRERVELAGHGEETGHAGLVVHVVSEVVLEGSGALGVLGQAVLEIGADSSVDVVRGVAGAREAEACD